MTLLAIRFTVEAEKPERALSQLVASRISFFKPRREEGGFSFATRTGYRKSVLQWAKANNYPISYKTEGVFSGLEVLKHRWGLAFGIILSLFLIYLSTFYVWSVRIEGNESISDGEILRLLNECGLHEGSLKRDVNVELIQNRAINRHHNISFLAVNLHGMVADVVVDERIYKPISDNKFHPFNLVADADGVIISSLILEGKKLFEHGETVEKGQLLVSGLMDSTGGTTLVRHASGKVFARTVRELTFEIPLQSVERIYTHTETVKGIRVLGKSLHGRIGDDTGNFDVSTEEEEIRFLGLRTPLTRELRTVGYYTEESVVISHEEAEARAYDEYRRYISTELQPEEITDEQFEVIRTDSSVILKATVRGTENIATEDKIETTE